MTDEQYIPHAGDRVRVRRYISPRSKVGHPGQKLEHEYIGSIAQVTSRGWNIPPDIKLAVEFCSGEDDEPVSISLDYVFLGNNAPDGGAEYLVTEIELYRPYPYEDRCAEGLRLIREFGGIPGHEQWLIDQLRAVLSGAPLPQGSGLAP
jgi:hypothetical protein